MNVTSQTSSGETWFICNRSLKFHIWAYAKLNSSVSRFFSPLSLINPHQWPVSLQSLTIKPRNRFDNLGFTWRYYLICYLYLLNFSYHYFWCVHMIVVHDHLENLESQRSLTSRFHLLLANRFIKRVPITLNELLVSAE